MDSHSFLLGNFPTQGSNPGLLHCGQILYHLSYQGSPIYSLSEFCWSEVWKDVTGFSAHKSDQHVLPAWTGWYWPRHGSDHLWWGTALMVSCSSGTLYWPKFCQSRFLSSHLKKGHLRESLELWSPRTDLCHLFLQEENKITEVSFSLCFFILFMYFKILFTFGCAGSLFCAGLSLAVAIGGYSLVAAHALLIVLTSLDVEHGL